ncbi:uncharacterized protein LOC144817954 [Lissotriton helveticus]
MEPRKQDYIFSQAPPESHTPVQCTSHYTSSGEDRPCAVQLEGSRGRAPKRQSHVHTEGPRAGAVAEVSMSTSHTDTNHTVQVGGGRLPRKVWSRKKHKWANSAKQRRLLISKLKKAKICATRHLKRTPKPGLNQNPQSDTAANSPSSQIPQDEDSETVFLESVRTYSRTVERFNATEHYEEFRFINLHRIRSSLHGHLVIQQAVQSLIDRLIRDVGPNDFFQLRFQGQGLDSPLFTKRRALDVFDAVEFLENLSKLLQSKAELVAYGTFRVIALIVRGREGGVSRPLKSVLYSKIIGKKQRWLLNFNNGAANTCLAASIVGLLMGRNTTDAVIMSRAAEAHAVLEIPPDRMVGFGDIGLFENYFAVTVKVLYHNGSWKYFTTGERVKNKTVYVLHHENHFYGILNLKSFLGVKYVCTHCDHIYNTKAQHHCEIHCKMCQRDGCVVDEALKVMCRTCKMFCRSQACLLIHREAIKCSPKMDCQECGRYVSTEHKCNGMKCPRCQIPCRAGFVHQCYMVKDRQPPKTEDYIVFDIECTQETGVHQPNYIYAHHLTSDDCWEFEGRTCVGDFLNTFIQSKFKGYTMLAHNSKAYDSFFILQNMIREKVQVELITQGSKLMLLMAGQLQIRFIDTLNFLPMKLSKLPKAFGFPGCKGYFPHFFNTWANQNYVGPMPPPDSYGVDYMMPAEKESFLQWYSENHEKEFNFQTELKAYCKADVMILRQACNLFRDVVVSMTKKVRVLKHKTTQMTKNVRVLKPKTPQMPKSVEYIDPFQNITLASMCMSIYKHMFLRPESMALVPPDLYNGKQKRYSTPSIQWLMYVSEKEDIDIRHALQGGEYRLGPYYLDGYAEIKGVRTAFEYNGCFYHGCPQCYKPHEFNRLLGAKFGHLHRRTMIRAQYVEKCGFALRVLWEHEWLEMIATNTELRSFLQSRDLPQPLEPRDALFGGRTNAIQLYRAAGEGEKIHYYDFTSLYPFVNKMKVYPLGHPTIIYRDFKPLSEYFGLVKCEIYPPRQLYFPVLPYRVEGKLLFPLCRTCAEFKEVGGCSHTEEQRMLTGTWCTIEVQAALDKGYRLGRVHEVWHFKRTTTRLFSRYINLFLRDKQEASGYPEWCTSQAAKQKYIDDYHTHEGIRLRPHLIEVNPARRQLAKLCLNSLWGKFAQRTNMSNTTLITDPDELFKYLFAPCYEVSSCEFIDDETAAVCWKYTKEYPTTCNNINIFIACFTTAHARLELYGVMDKLQDRCLYHDTDSVIFLSKPGDEDPPLGDYLGNLTSELDKDEYIIEYTSAGPKTYSYKTNTNKVCMKVKGITLNVSNTLKINFDSLKDLVHEYSAAADHENDKTIVVNQPCIVRSKKKWEITTQPLHKTLRVVFDKRVLTTDYKTLPYGY